MMNGLLSEIGGHGCKMRVISMHLAVHEFLFPPHKHFSFLVNGSNLSLDPYDFPFFQEKDNISIQLLGKQAKLNGCTARKSDCLS